MSKEYDNWLAFADEDWQGLWNCAHQIAEHLHSGDQT